MTEAETYPIEWMETDFASIDNPFEEMETEQPLDEPEIIEGFVEGILQDKRLSHIDAERLETAARIIARGLSGDENAMTAMTVLATGIQLANTPLGWMVSRYVTKCRER